MTTNNFQTFKLSNFLTNKMSEEEKNTTSRRDAIRTMFQGAGYVALGGLFWGGYLEEAKGAELALRPPGAITEDNFIKACIKCGVCVEACPYDTLKLAKPAEDLVVGTPYFKPRDIPCYMCTDIPCVPVCPTGALDIKSLSVIKEGKSTLDINKSKMGLAVVNKETCIAFWGVQCDACYRACPLMDEAITIEYEKNERTGKHAFLKPVVHADVCTGCGLCEHACVTDVPAIKTLPIAIAMGEVGAHYIKGWDKDDEQRLNNSEEVEDNGDSESAIDYLNDADDLFND